VQFDRDARFGKNFCPVQKFPFTPARAPTAVDRSSSAKPDKIDR